MKLFLLRHAIAEDAAPGQADSERPLTDKGREKLRRVLRRARQAGLDPQTVCSSPFLRARQTAAIAVEELEHGNDLIETRNLTPFADIVALWNEVRAFSRDDQVLLIGHNPHLTNLLCFVTGAPPHGFDLKKASLACLSLRSTGPQPRGTLLWLLTPKIAGS